MVDFGRYNRERREAMSDEQRVVYDAAVAKREAVEADRRPIASRWVSCMETPVAVPMPIGITPRNAGRLSRAIARSERKVTDREIAIGIEVLGEGTEDARDVVSFTPSPSGYASFVVDERFVEILEGIVEEDGRFWVCAGTIGRYDECSVDARDVLEYLMAMRPELASANAVPSHPPSAPTPRA